MKADVEMEAKAYFMTSVRMLYLPLLAAAARVGIGLRAGMKWWHFADCSLYFISQVVYSTAEMTRRAQATSLPSGMYSSGRNCPIASGISFFLFFLGTGDVTVISGMFGPLHMHVVYRELLWR